MSGTDAVSEALGEENDSAIPDGVTSLMETLAPSVADRFGSGNFATVAGGVSLFRAYRSYRKGRRKRALLRGAVGLFWVAVAVAQRRGRSDSGPGPSEVANTSPDLEEAVEPGERDTDHATGSEVVNTTDADIEESDTAPELDSDASDADVDQRDVVGTDEVETAIEEAEGEASESGETDSEGTESNETGSEGTETEETDGERTDSSGDAETGSAE
jgi:hypothetical protein